MKKIFLFVMMASSVSFGDILFLDLNDSSKEIEAAQRAAKRRNEKLIVLPQFSSEEKNKTKKHREQMNRFQNRMSQVCSRDYFSQECHQITSEYRQLANNYYKNVRSFNVEDLGEELEKLKKQGVKISSLVVSGHDGNGHFTGVNGTLDDEGMKEAFERTSPVGEGIRSLFLWGCYTSNIGSLLQNWKRSFPQAELIAGYDGSAPLADKPANWRYLEDALVKEKKLSAIKDEKELLLSFKQLDGVNLLNASICVDGKYVSKKSTLNLRDAQSMCKKILDETKDIYACYLYAQKGCEDPPQNTSSSELRSMYNKLQDGRHCAELNSIEVRGIPSPDVTLRLIFYKNIKDNFVKNDPGVIRQYNDLLKKVGAPDSLLWGDLKAMNRADILKKLNEQNDFLTSAGKDERADTPEIMSLSLGRQMLQGILGDLNVPFAWVEPGLNTQELAQFSEEFGQYPGVFRSGYEETRANNKIAAKARELMLADTETGADYKPLVEQFESLQKKLNEGTYTKEESKEYVAVYKKMLAKEIELLPRVERQLKIYAEEVKNEPYAHEEGKKVFAKKVDDVVASTDALKSSLQFIFSPTSGLGGFGMGMGMGASTPASSSR